VRIRHSPFAGGRGGEFGELHCKLGHAMAIELGLRPQSLKIESFSNFCQRLSAIPLRKWPETKPEYMGLAPRYVDSTVVGGQSNMTHKGAEDLNRWTVANEWAVAYRKYSRARVADEERERSAGLQIRLGDWRQQWQHK
jgi:hypothetical protein